MTGGQFAKGRKCKSESQRCRGPGCVGSVDHCRDSAFYSESNGHILEGSEKRSDGLYFY